MTSKAQKRKNIMDAAARLFLKNGFENTTTRDIAQAAGISNSALYYYFDSKEDLLFRILDGTLDVGLRKIKEIEDSEHGLEDKLQSILGIHTSDYAEDTAKMDLMLEVQKSLTSEHKEVLRQKQRTYMKVLEDILNRLKADNKVVQMNTKVLAFAFFGMVNWAFRWYNPEGEISPKELARIFSFIYTRGVYTNPEK